MDISILQVNRHFDKRLPHIRLMDKTTVGGRVKALRTTLGLTQVQLSKKSGVPQPTISDIERGHTKDLAGDNLTRLCAALNTNPQWLIFSKGTPGPAIQTDIDESELLNLYRALSDEQKASLLSVVRSMQTANPQAPSATNPFPNAVRRKTTSP